MVYRAYSGPDPSSPCSLTDPVVSAVFIVHTLAMCSTRPTRARYNTWCRGPLVSEGLNKANLGPVHGQAGGRMMEVNRRLAERVWAASEDGLRNAQIADRMRCSMKTVARVRSARTAFESGDTDKHIAGKTGWSERRVAQVREWWRSYAPARHVGQTVRPGRGDTHDRSQAGLTPEEQVRGQLEGFAEPAGEGSGPVLMRVETPIFYRKVLPIHASTDDREAWSWVLDVRLSNPSRTLPIGVRNIRLEITKGEEVHSVPHLGESREGWAEEVPFSEGALPVSLRIDPVETRSGRLRFFEPSGFTVGKVKLVLVLEEADGRVHRHTVAEALGLPI